VPPLATAFMRVMPTTAGFGTALAAGVVKEGERGEAAAASLGLRMGSKMRIGLTEQFKGLAAPLLASLAAFATFEGLKDMAHDAQLAGVENRITAQAIKSTGEAAHVSGKEVSELAEHLARLTGKNAEVIHSGENLLLTFTQVQNRVGEGNDIFDQASAAATDMTAAMNNGVVSQEGMKASAIQLGKALNNPIVGMTALQRIGVSFTEQQREQIKTLAQSGNVLDAQKIILREVMTEFGGAAAASSSATERLGNRIHSLKVQIGEELIPVFNAAALAINDRLVPAAGAFFLKLDLGERIKHTAEAARDLAQELLAHLEPGLRNAWQAAENLARIAVNLEHAFQPLIVLAAQLGIGLAVATFLALARAVESVTGFLAKHQTVVLALAAAYGLHLLGGIVGVVRLVTSGWETVALRGMYAWSAATDAATSATVRLAVAQGALTIGVAAIAALAFSKWTRDTQEAKKGAEEFRKALEDMKTGSTAAIEKISDEYRKWHPEGANFTEGAKRIDAAVAHVNGTIAELSQETGLSTSRIKELAKAGKIDLTGSFDQVNEKFLSYRDSLTEGGAKQVELTEGMKELASSAGDAKKQLQALKDSLDALTGKQLGVNEATRSYQAAIDDLTDSVKKNGQTLDLGTEKGRANSEALDKIASSITDMITAEVAAGDSTDKVTGDFRGMYDQLIASAEQLGLTKEQAEAYAQSLGLVPDNVDTLIAAAGATQSTDQVNKLTEAIDRLSGKTVPVGETGAILAKQQVGNLDRQIADLHGKLVSITQQGAQASAGQVAYLQGEIDRLQSKRIEIDTILSFREQGLSGKDLRQARLLAGLPSAEGNLFVQSFADGGIAKILPPGPTLFQWREPSTGGEAFIPLGLHLRARSLAILGEVARRFGYGLAQNPAGAAAGWSPPAASPAPAPQPTYTRMHPDDLMALADILSSRPLQVNFNGRPIDSQLGLNSQLLTRGG
jgi:hypothetical protein